MPSKPPTMFGLRLVQLLLLFATALPARGQQGARKLLQAESLGTLANVRGGFEDLISQPFLPIKDAEGASSQDAQRLYEQASRVSAIGYLLLGAAGPLSLVTGSSPALLSLLTPPILRIYASQPGFCSSPGVAQLYELSRSLLYGSTALQACHYELFKAIRATFGWVAENIPLRLQDVPGQPQATAAWPDPAAISDADFASAVSKALLSSQTELREAAAVLASGTCGMDIRSFAALVPRISSALTQLHADFEELQMIADELLASSREHQRKNLHLGASQQRRAALELDDSSSSSSSSSPHVDPKEEEDDSLGASSGWPSRHSADDDSLRVEEEGNEMSHRRVLQQQQAAALPSTFVYSMPPDGFKVQPSSAMPKLLIGLVFHIMQYRDGNSIGPVGYGQAAAYLQRMIRIANFMSEPTNITFFIKEVRNDATAYPYLLLKNRRAWLGIADDDCTGKICIKKSDLALTTVVDFPRSINVYVASDAVVTKGFVGYSYAPGSEFFPIQGYVFMTWDQVTVSGANALALYNDGATTLLHEVFHFLGVYHPFMGSPGNCTDGDYVSDTPASIGSIFGASFFWMAANYCMEVFWGLYGGDWEGTYQRMRTTLGIPDLDKNAWADSCPNLPGYDELGNYMAYNTPVCFAALGHFTPGQAQWAHHVTSEVNPVLYAWAQYYAAQAAPPPPMLSPPSEPVNNICRVTAKSSCACKSVWRFNRQQFSYCDRTGGLNELTCEVEDRTSCPDCKPGAAQCILQCAGTPQICKRPPAPGVSLPPPPPPLPPTLPPMPPPPPPLAVPEECKVSDKKCACRSSWIYNFKGGYYCSPYYGSRQGLWCVVTPACPSFMESPLQQCVPTLAATYCNGTASSPLPQPRLPPASPARPPPRGPKKPRRPR